jgi:hypothetical protein
MLQRLCYRQKRGMIFFTLKEKRINLKSSSLQIHSTIKKKICILKCWHRDVFNFIRKQISRTIILVVYFSALKVDVNVEYLITNIIFVRDVKFFNKVDDFLTISLMGSSTDLKKFLYNFLFFWVSSFCCFIFLFSFVAVKNVINLSRKINSPKNSKREMRNTKTFHFLQNKLLKWKLPNYVFHLSMMLRSIVEVWLGAIFSMYRNGSGLVQTRLNCTYLVLDSDRSLTYLQTGQKLGQVQDSPTTFFSLKVLFDQKYLLHATI